MRRAGPSGDEAESDPGSRLPPAVTTRQFLAGSGTAVGGLAGCLGDGDSPVEEVTDAPDTSPTPDGPPRTLTVDQLTTAAHNTVVYAAEFETLNEAVDAARDRTEGRIEVVLPPGTTRYTDTIYENDRSITIRGAGMNASRLAADGAERLVYGSPSEDAGRVSMVLSGFTLDMMQVPGQGRAVYFDGGHTLAIRDVRVEEINLAEREHVSVLINATALERFAFRGNEIRYDTVTNRAGAGPRHKIRVVSSTDPVVRFVAVGNRLIGERLPIDERPEKNFMNGFRAEIAPEGVATIRDNVFENWDQYATNVDSGRGASIFVVNNAIPNAGDADLIRASGDGATIVIHGNAIEKGDDLAGDRGIIPGTGSVPDSIQITNNYVEGVLVPVEVNRGARNIVVADNTFRNCGHRDEERPAVYLRTAAGGGEEQVMRNARVTGNVIDNAEADRTLAPLVRFAGNAWEGYAVVEHNVADGIAAETMEDAVVTNWDDPDVELVVRDNLLTPPPDGHDESTPNEG